jgi:hypothetical protein
VASSFFPSGLTVLFSHTVKNNSTFQSYEREKTVLFSHISEDRGKEKKKRKKAAFKKLRSHLEINCICAI